MIVVWKFWTARWSEVSRCLENDSKWHLDQTERIMDKKENIFTMVIEIVKARKLSLAKTDVNEKG